MGSLPIARLLSTLRERVWLSARLYLPACFHFLTHVPERQTFPPPLLSLLVFLSATVMETSFSTHLLPLLALTREERLGCQFIWEI